MKIAVSVIFGALSALVIAGGVFLGLRNQQHHQDFLEERKELSARVTELETQTFNWDGLPEDVARIRTELDSITDTLLLTEQALSERLGVQGPLYKSPRFAVGEPHEGGGWRVYPFTLTIEGRPAAVDSFLRDLNRDLPLTRMDQIDAILKSSRRLKLDIKGLVRFPLQD
jgi:hypothetical protein